MYIRAAVAEPVDCYFVRVGERYSSFFVVVAECNYICNERAIVNFK